MAMANPNAEFDGEVNGVFNSLKIAGAACEGSASRFTEIGDAVQKSLVALDIQVVFCGSDAVIVLHAAAVQAIAGLLPIASSVQHSAVLSISQQNCISTVLGYAPFAAPCQMQRIGHLRT
eukprot:TRINITY_DN25799_c0_g1_i2.p2 TRINITY_DN25799_c0_g1~~TRINITY_DN25799_c0_g1_i2.p2  ORF type:complete len:120 (-),score=11.53 TRINITY_DN25799_c0_g1_i2:134-493(-)